MSQLSMRLAVCALLLAAAVRAETVAWYRFEDREAPAPTDYGTAVTNSAGGYLAWPKTINGTETYETPGSVYLPSYTNGAPSSLPVYDPVSGRLADNARALHFHQKGAADTQGGYLLVSPTAAEEARLRAITNLTLEAFVRVPADIVQASAYMMPIIHKENASFQATWMLALYEARLFFRCSVKRADGTTKGIGWGNGQKTPLVNDGRWHHVAVVFDFGKQTARAYVDYAQVNESPLVTDALPAVGFDHPVTSRLLIGGNDLHNTRRFNGEIDEVRISDEALDVSQFLRLAGPRRFADADTFVHLACETDFGDGGVSPTLMSVYDSATGTVRKIVYEGLTDRLWQTNEVWGTSLLRDAQAGDLAKNAGSFFSCTNDAGKGCTFTIADDTDDPLASRSFTLEIFFRTHGATSKPAEGNVYRHSFALFKQYNFKVLLNGENRKMLFRVDGMVGGDLYAEKCWDDGDWHHLAYVYDAEAKALKGYVDYRQVVSAANCTMKGDASEIRVGGDSAGYQVFNGNLDEVRITRRALPPEQFLRILGTGTCILVR